MPPCIFLKYECVHIYVHAYTCTCAYVYMCIYTYIDTYLHHVYTYVYITCIYQVNIFTIYIKLLSREHDFDRKKPPQGGFFFGMFRFEEAGGREQDKKRKKEKEKEKKETRSEIT